MTSTQRPYRPMTLRRIKTRTISRAQLEAGYVVRDADGTVERRDYVVLAYIVKDPQDDRRPA